MPYPVAGQAAFVSESRTAEALIALTFERLRFYARPAACAIYLANDDGDLVAVDG